MACVSLDRALVAAGSRSFKVATARRLTSRYGCVLLRAIVLAICSAERRFVAALPSWHLYRIRSNVACGTFPATKKRGYYDHVFGIIEKRVNEAEGKL
jgi:hypothetical protein